MTNFKNTLMELAKGLGMYKGSPTSCYVVIIPPNRKEVIRIRLSDHPSTKDEWVAGEITGLPNRRYSIVIFSNKSMPLQSKQNVKETDWTNYDVEGIPVYEKCFNRIYLKDTIQTLLSILISIYEGKSPSTGSTQITKENKQYRNTNTTMKQTIKLNESQLRGLIKESIKKVLNENERDIDDDTYFGGGLPDSYYQDPAHEQPNEYDNDEPSIPEDIGDFIYERLKNQPDKVDRFDAKNLNALGIRLGNVYRELRNHIGEEDSIKYIREYVKYYLPDYETVYNKLRHVVEEAKWLFNENI